MPIIDTITNYNRLYDDLKKMDRENFSYEGAQALMEYLDNLSDEIGENIEYDPVGFCCEYTEHTSAVAAFEEYGQAFDDDLLDDDDKEENALEWLQGETTVIEFSDGVIIQDF